MGRLSASGRAQMCLPCTHQPGERYILSYNWLYLCVCGPEIWSQQCVCEMFMHFVRCVYMYVYVYVCVCVCMCVCM